MTFIRGPAPLSKYSTPTARWKDSAEAALVGFGGLAGEAFRRTACLLGRSLRATEHTGTRWVGDADHLAVTATVDRSFVNLDNSALAASTLLPRISLVEAPFAATKKSAEISDR